MTEKKLIIGIGSGRCGTKSLASLLNSQPDTTVWHEARPLLDWYCEPEQRRRRIAARLARLSRISETSFVGDVASFYLPYLPELFELSPAVKVICLKRNRDEVIHSFRQFLAKTEPLPTNHWRAEPWRDRGNQTEFHNFYWSRIFPKYADVGLEAGVGHYWDEYYARVAELKKGYAERILLLETQELNDEDKQREALTFCGFSVTDQVTRPYEEHTIEKVASCLNVNLKNRVAPAHCVVLVPYAENIGESCESGLRGLEAQGYPVRRIPVRDDRILAMNSALFQVLREGFLETMWIDPTVRFHPDSLTLLRQHQADIACIPVFDRQGPVRSYQPSDSPDVLFGQQGEIVHVDTASLKFLHVRRYVYESIANNCHVPLIEDYHGPLIPFFAPALKEVADGAAYLNPGESFSQMARECGFGILADCRIRLWNTDDYSYGWEDSGITPQRTDHQARRLDR